MLTITVGATESIDDATNEFVLQGGVQLRLEHSLISLSKWESKHEKPFLSETEKTAEELFSYIECMVLDENPPGNFLTQLSERNMQEINEYINAKMTATWFAEVKPETKKEVITAELVYYWLDVYQIPWEVQYWHINRLFTLIRVHSVKQEKPKKMSRSEQAERRRQLNAQRKAQLGTKG